VGAAGTAVALGQEARSTVGMDKAAADRRRTVSHPCRFRRWQRAGTWQRIFAQLRLPAFEQVLNKIRVARTGSGRPRARPNRVRADKAYASRKNRAYAGIVARAVAVRRSSTRSAIELGTRSSAASIA